MSLFFNQYKKNSFDYYEDFNEKNLISRFTFFQLNELSNDKNKYNVLCNAALCGMKFGNFIHQSDGWYTIEECGENANTIQKLTDHIVTYHKDVIEDFISAVCHYRSLVKQKEHKNEQKNEFNGGDEMV